MGEEDSIFIQVSTNCGEDWIDVDDINWTTYTETDDYTPYEISLASYAGERIFLRIYVEKDDVAFPLSPNITFTIDNIKLFDEVDYDFGVVNIDNL